MHDTKSYQIEFCTLDPYGHDILRLTWILDWLPQDLQSAFWFQRAEFLIPNPHSSFVRDSAPACTSKVWILITSPFLHFTHLANETRPQLSWLIRPIWKLTSGEQKCLANTKQNSIFYELVFFKKEFFNFSLYQKKYTNSFLWIFGHTQPGNCCLLALSASKWVMMSWEQSKVLAPLWIWIFSWCRY